MRKIAIFGNGLGRALDNKFFDLEVALQHAWSISGNLTDAQKALIWQCLPQHVIETDDAEPPKTEAELGRLQSVLAACDVIRKYECDGGESWLTENGKKFPDAIRGYIHCAASYFNTGDHRLPQTFVRNLVNWVSDTRSHIATLNYDELLYRSFMNTTAFNGYDCLLDGFVPDFKPQNLDRKTPLRQAYYLHLHGSPLYYNTPDGAMKKARLSQLPKIEGYSSTHIVLTEVHHKSSVINASLILREYWRRLEAAMSEVDSLILFGYGGGDVHLNKLIERNFRGKRVLIVERSRSDTLTKEGREERTNCWSSKLGVHVHCEWFDCILDFSEWNWHPETWPPSLE